MYKLHKRIACLHKTHDWNFYCTKCIELNNDQNAAYSFTLETEHI